MELHSKTLKEISKAIYLELNSELGEGLWDSAVLDIRMPPDGGCGMSMTRVRAGRHVNRRHMSSTAAHELTLMETRDHLPGGPWFGLYVVVRSNGKVKVKYDYDPDCIDGLLDDVRFYDE